MRAATPERAEPDGTRARRPRGRVLAWASALVLSAGLSAAAVPAAADEAPLPDPVRPQPVLVLAECSASLSLVDLAPGRSYSLLVADAAGAVEFSEPVWVADGRVLDSFATVPPGEHTLVVTDLAAPEFTVVRPISVAPCTDAGGAADPVVVAGRSLDAPGLVVEPETCDLLGATDVRVSAAGLGAGTYTTGATSGGTPVAGVTDATLTASSSSTMLADLPNGGSYVVWLKNPSGSVVATASVALPICDLPTLSDPTEGAATGVKGRTLAETGAPPLPLIAIAGLAALQLGALAGGIVLVRKRAGRHTVA